MLSEYFKGRVYARIEVIPREERARLAEIVAGEAARVLGIPAPRVRFFCPQHWGESVRGYVSRDGEIHVNHDQSDKDVFSAIVHEMRHIWQGQSPAWRDRSETLKENDARLFAISWPRRSDIDGDNFRKLLASY